jgi:hypothetical protein
LKTIKKIFFYLFTFIFYLGFVQAQPVKKDFTFYRGDYIKLTFQVNGNVTSYNLLFAIKLTKSFTSPRLIQKTNAIASQISATYTAPFTKIDVYLLPEDTRDLTSKVYYYDLVKINPAYSTDETTLFTGEFKNDADVITPFDGTALPTDGTRITTVSVDNGIVQDEMIYWDTTSHRWKPAGTTLSTAQKDSVGNIVSDSLSPVRTSLSLKLDKSDSTLYATQNDIVSIKSILVKNVDTLSLYSGSNRLFKLFVAAPAISSIIGGFTGNMIDAGYGDVIAGGGSAGFENIISGNSFGRVISGGYDNYVGGSVVSTISGGGHNAITGTSTHGTIGGGSLDSILLGNYGTIAGGTNNKVSADNTTIGGGSYNIISGQASTISGGTLNTVPNNYSTISGGITNYAGSIVTVIGGGQSNFISDISNNGTYSVIGGGLNDSIATTSLSSHSTIAGGKLNKINGQYVFIGGGYANQVSNSYSAIAGGSTNKILGTYGFIGGGGNNSCGSASSVISGGYLNYIDNTTTRGDYSVINGGYTNSIGTTASSRFSTIAGGRENVINGEYSFAFGNRIKLTGNGITAFADGTVADFTVATANTFYGRFSGGYNLKGGDAIFEGNTKVKIFTATLTDSVPSALELNAATGKTPVTVGAGWTTLIKDSDGSGLIYRVVSDGTSWYYFISTKAL